MELGRKLADLLKEVASTSRMEEIPKLKELFFYDSADAFCNPSH
jgi:hypothetical protein